MAKQGFLAVAELLGYDVSGAGPEFIRANLGAVLREAVEAGLLTKREAGRLRHKLAIYKSQVRVERTWGNKAGRGRWLKRAWHRAERQRVKNALRRGDWDVAAAAILAPKYASEVARRGW